MIWSLFAVLALFVVTLSCCFRVLSIEDAIGGFLLGWIGGNSMKSYRANKLKSKKKRLRRLFGGTAIFILLYFCFGSDYNLYKLWKLNQKKKEVLSHIKHLKLEKEQLSLEIERLNNDLAYIEKKAREDFKMGKKGEKIYIIRDSK